MKVFVVNKVSHSNFYTIGVFSTEDKAIKYLIKLGVVATDSAESGTENYFYTNSSFDYSIIKQDLDLENMCPEGY